MSQLIALGITAALLLLPLAPATVLYRWLSSKRGASATSDEAEGKMTLPGWLGGMQLQFNVVGSSATYVVLLVFSFLVYDRAETQQVKREALRERRAWLVEVPVGLTDADDQHIPAENRELQQVRIDLEPRFSTATANDISFWVVPQNGKFPSARFVYPKVGLSAEVLNLNDETVVEYDYATRKITGIDPVWLPVGEVYK